jgi:hypothetical protein
VTEQRITFTDAALARDYVLDVAYDVINGRAEIHSCICVEVVTWCGDRCVTADPWHADEERANEKLGQWCLETYPEQIQAAIAELNEALQDGGMTPLLRRALEHVKEEQRRSRDGIIRSVADLREACRR